MNFRFEIRVFILLFADVLVATKRKMDRLKHMTTDEISDFFQTVCKIEKLTEEYYETTSSTVTVQDGENAGQTVRHVHCHIMPRRKGDFQENDEIYIELNKHEVEYPRRPLDEMIKEATEYRNLLKML